MSPTSKACCRRRAADQRTNRNETSPLSAKTNDGEKYYGFAEIGPNLSAQSQNGEDGGGRLGYGRAAICTPNSPRHLMGRFFFLRRSGRERNPRPASVIRTKAEGRAD